MSVTITASANSTIPASTVFATCQLGTVHYEAIMLADTAGSIIGGPSNPLSACVSNSPSVVVSSGSLIVTNAISASISNTLTASAIQSTGAAITSPWAMRLSDSVDSAAITAASEVLVSVNNVASVVVSSGSVVVTNALSASISGGSVALLTGANTIGAASVIQGVGACPAAAWPMRLTDLTDTAAITAASELLVFVNNVASAVISSGSVTVTNALSASISGGSVALLAGANVIGTASVIQSTPTGIGNAWPMKITDGTDTAVVNAASRLLVSASLTDELTVTSASVTVVNNGIASPIFSRLTDGTDTVAVNSSSQLLVAVSSASVTIVDGSGNVYGVSAGSPLYITGGAAGGTSSNDKTAFAEGSTAFTPTGGVFLETTASLTASQMGVARLTASRALHVNLRDASGLQLGVSAASPLYVSNTAGGTSLIDDSTFTVSTTRVTPIGAYRDDTGTNTLAEGDAGGLRLTEYRGLHVNLRDASGLQLGVSAGSPLYVAASAVVTNAVSASISGGSVALLAGANVIGSASVIQSTAAPYTAPWPVKQSDGTDSLAITTASEALVFVNNIPGASILNTVTVIPGASGASPWGVKILDSDGLAYGIATASPLFAKLSDGTDSVAVDAASRLLTAACVVNTASVIVSSGSLVVTNGLSASISGGSVALLAGANVIGSASVIQSTAAAYTSPWPVKQSDGTDSLSITAASEALVFVNNVASVIVSSGSIVVTNALSASISGGSVALLTGANVIGSASAIQGTAAAITSPWSVKISDSVDSVTVDAASRLNIAIADSGNAYGYPASPLVVAGQGQTIYWAGSQLTIQKADISSSAAGCTRIVASTSGAAIVVLAATFTTSSCQFIGWVASGAGGASAAVQTRMPFGTNGGMDANRCPHGYLWAFPSGSNAIITTTSACVVAGTINYISVAS